MRPGVHPLAQDRRLRRRRDGRDARDPLRAARRQGDRPGDRRVGVHGHRQPAPAGFGPRRREGGEPRLGARRDVQVRSHPDAVAVLVARGRHGPAPARRRDGRLVDRGVSEERRVRHGVPARARRDALGDVPRHGGISVPAHHSREVRRLPEQARVRVAIADGMPAIHRVCYGLRAPEGHGHGEVGQGHSVQGRKRQVQTNRAFARGDRGCLDEIRRPTGWSQGGLQYCQGALCVGCQNGKQRPRPVANCG